MKFIKLILITALILPLGGCFGSEPNDIAYIVALGFDKSENDTNYKLTIQFAKPTQISGGASEEGGKGGPDIIENITVEAPNIYAGINIANHIVSKKFSLFHTKLFVFSQEIAQEGVGDLLETMSRSEEIRPDVYIAVALGTASDYLRAVKPVVELNPAKYYQLSFDKNDSAGYPRCTLQDFYVLENIDYSDIAVPLAGVINSDSSEMKSGEGMSESGNAGESTKSKSSENESGNADINSENRGNERGINISEIPKEQSSEDESGSEQESTGSVGEKNKNNADAPMNESGFEYKIKNYLAGQTAVEEENKSEVMGMAVFTKQQMTGVLGGTDSVLYNILNGDYKGSYVTFYNNKNPENPITVKIIQIKKPHTNLNIKNKTIDIKLFLESNFYSLSSGYVLEEDIENFERSASEEIRKASVNFIKNVRDEYGADILGLGLKAKRSFLTNQSFSDYNWRERFKEYDINVNVDFKVRRNGLTLRKAKGE